jgi:phosphomannomutase
VNVPEYLEEIQRRHGLFLGSQRSFIFPGRAGAAQISQILEGFRSRPPAQMGVWRVNTVRDYQRGGNLPSSNVLAYELVPDARITLRPSGTEPKIKYYFEVKENVGSGEPISSAQRRAQSQLSALEVAFLQLAKERGQQLT